MSATTGHVEVEPVTRELLIAAPIDRVWAALTDAGTIGAWMEDPTVNSDLRPGGAYALFDGETTGTYRSVEAPSRLAYSWRQASWPVEWPDSEVTWELEDTGGSTKVRLRHRGFPNRDERDSHDDGWDVFFIDPMKAWLESS